MPPRQFSSRDVLTVLAKAGWRQANPDSGGSHVVMTKQDHAGEKYTVTVPRGYDPIKPGTLRSIAKQAGAQDFDAFCRWIDTNCYRDYRRYPDIRHARIRMRLTIPVEKSMTLDDNPYRSIAL